MARSVTIKAGKNGVLLPNGVSYDAGATVTISDAQWLQISSGALANYVTDNGVVTGAEDQVLTQGAAVAAPAALTSANAAGSTPTQAEFNKVVADLVALRTTVAALQANLTGTSKPLHP